MDDFTQLIRTERDPARRARLLCALMVSKRHVGLPWYDGKVNDRIAIARHYLAQVAPAALPRFDQRLALFRANPQLELNSHRNFLPADVYGDLQDYLAGLAPDQFKQGEITLLGRVKLNDQAAFKPAFDCAQALLERQLGRPLRQSYSMFVRYFSDGRLPVHLDSLDSQYSVGICINRSASWPMRCSSIIDEPLSIALEGWSEQSVLNDPVLDWTTLDPEPNEAFVFAPAHQWHWRDAIGPGQEQPYDMLYFSFVDAAGYDLLRPARWSAGFGIAELEDLATVLALTGQDRKGTAGSDGPSA